MASTPLGDLFDTLPQTGRLEWIGLRPARGAPMHIVDSAILIFGRGLDGDRFAARRDDNPRQVTLIQHEHLSAIAALVGLEAVPPELLRRNLVVSGINLLALKDRRFRIGGALLEYGGRCHPCSRMERALGPGGYNAMRGHGGITVRVIEAGPIQVGDSIAIVAAG